MIGVVLGVIMLFGLIFVVQTKFEAPRKEGPKVLYRVPETATTMAITGDLKYYNFIKDENVLKFTLWLKGGIFGIDVKKGVTYELSQTMSTWQIASILLNKIYPGQTYDCNHGCPEGNFNPNLLPGGDLAPTITQKYEWVKTYEDCVKAVGTGHDGGQLSSEQNHIQTGRPRFCISPDGREFTQGKEGWTTAVGG